MLAEDGFTGRVVLSDPNAEAPVWAQPWHPAAWKHVGGSHSSSSFTHRASSCPGAPSALEVVGQDVTALVGDAAATDVGFRQELIDGFQDAKAARGAAAEAHLRDRAGVTVLPKKMVDRSLRDGLVPPRAPWYPSGECY